MPDDLIVTHPPDLPVERRWVLDVILRDWLGLHYELMPGEPGWTIITAPGSAGRLAIADCFLPAASRAWLRPESLPKLPLSVWSAGADLPDAPLASPDLPILFGRTLAREQLVEIGDVSIRLGLDIPGSVFFMLTRYEEVVVSSRDRHGRFPAAASVASQANFLGRPLANEYVEVLWACMVRLWPRLTRRQRSYAVSLSHDVDRPFDLTRPSLTRAARRLGVDLLLQRDPALVVRRLTSWLQRNDQRWLMDPNNTFDLIQDTSEAHGLRSTFYFKAGCTEPRYDDHYPLDAPQIRKLLREVHDRGHEIGLHPSYNTWQDAAQLANELATLRRATERLGIAQETWGARQHYLRLEVPQTWRHYEAVGLVYDATMTYADQVGFRCGTCYEFRTFDLAERRPLQLRERPLIVMECSLFDRPNGRSRRQEAYDTITDLARTCRQFSGVFSMLWHNSELVTAWQKRFYADIVRDVTT